MMNKFSSFILSLLLLFAFSCSESNSQKIQISGQVQGTYYAITYYDKNGRNFLPEIIDFLKSFDKIASLWDKESEISRINNNEVISLDSIFIDIFQKAMMISESTQGYFDITIGPLTNAWGFGYSDRQRMDSSKIDSLLQFVGNKKIILREGKIHKQDSNIRIDFNAIAKGYSVDMIGVFLESKNIHNYLIDIGGEVLSKGKKPNDKPWIIGIETPAKNQYSNREVGAKIQLINSALATSGNYRKYYEENGARYSHTINPKTGYPINHNLLSVTVLAEKCWEADAYATAFMVMGLQESINFLAIHTKLEAYFIYSENNEMNIYATKGFKKHMVD